MAVPGSRATPSSCTFPARRWQWWIAEATSPRAVGSGVIPALALAAALLSASAAVAGPALDGTFVATRSCPAFQSIKARSNPGNIATEPRREYAVREINEAGGEFYRMIIPGAPSVELRWVSAACGRHVPLGADVDAATKSDVQSPVRPPQPDRSAGLEPAAARSGGASSLESTRNTLAVSWQSAVCEAGSEWPECRLLNGDDLAAAAVQFSLHGLWPEGGASGNGRAPDYCGVSDFGGARSWRRLPPVALSAPTRRALEAVMPGTMSFLDRHQWLKHGTCYRAAGGAEEYFADAIRLVNELNGSDVREVFADAIGRRLDADDVRDAFDAAFGPGAGRRVTLECERDGGRTIIVELRISLSGTIAPGASVKDLLASAPERSRGCPGGIVDAAGLD